MANLKRLQHDLEFEEELDYSEEQVARIIENICAGNTETVKQLLEYAKHEGGSQSEAGEYWNKGEPEAESHPGTHAGDESGKEAIAKALKNLDHDETTVEATPGCVVLRQHEKFCRTHYGRVIRDSWGPLEYAVYHGKDAIVSHLLEHGFGRVYLERQRKQEKHLESYNLPSRAGHTARHEASFSSLPRKQSRQNSKASSFSSVIEPHKPSQSRKSNRRWGGPRHLGGQDTPLHWAAYYGNVSLVCILLEYGLSATMVDTSGNTPLHLAASGAANRKGHHIQVAQILISEAVPLRQTNWFGHTPLAISATKSMRKLLKKAIRGDLEFFNMLSRSGLEDYHQRLKDVHGLLDLRLACDVSDSLVVNGEHGSASKLEEVGNVTQTIDEPESTDGNNLETESSDKKSNLQPESSNKKNNSQPESSNKKNNSQPESSNKKNNSQPESSDKKSNLQPESSNKNNNSQPESSDKNNNSQPETTEQDNSNSPKSNSALKNEVVEREKTNPFEPETSNAASNPTYISRVLYLVENEDAVYVAEQALAMEYKNFVAAETVAAVGSRLHQLKACVQLQRSICNIITKRPLTSGRYLRQFYDCLEALKSFDTGDPSFILSNMAVATIKVAEQLRKSCELEIGVSQALVPTNKVRTISTFNTRVVETLDMLLRESQLGSIPIHKDLLQVAKKSFRRSSSILTVLRSANEQAESERLALEEARRLEVERAAQALTASAEPPRKGKGKGKKGAKDSNLKDNGTVKKPNLLMNFEALDESEFTKQFDDCRERVAALRDSLYCLFPWHNVVVEDKLLVQEQLERARADEEERIAEEARLKVGNMTKGKKKKKKSEKTKSSNSSITKAPSKDKQPVERSKTVIQVPQTEQTNLDPDPETNQTELSIESGEQVVHEDMRERAMRRFCAIREELEVMMVVHQKREAKREQELKLLQRQQLADEAASRNTMIQEQTPKRRGSTGKKAKGLKGRKSGTSKKRTVKKAK